MIELSDTGIGLDAASPSTSRDGGGFGLEQVRERLTTVYGPRAALALAPGEHTGTRATLRFPLQASSTGDAPAASHTP